VLDGALTSNSEYLVTDTSQMLDVKERQSIVAFDLRTVICMPLRKPLVQTTRERAARRRRSDGRALRRFAFCFARYHQRQPRYSARHRDRSCAVDRERAPGAGRRSRTPLPAGVVDRRLHSAASAGGDSARSSFCAGEWAQHVLQRNRRRFFRSREHSQGLAVVLADVSGKGVSAALLASILQGMVYSQLISGMPLVEIVDAVNRFFTYKHIGEKYATMIITRLRNDGDLEYVNCGHIPPVWICGNK
jgi:hypothetical protein